MILIRCITSALWALLTDSFPVFVTAGIHLCPGQFLLPVSDEHIFNFQGNDKNGKEVNSS
jgi:hypothetical protein